MKSASTTNKPDVIIIGGGASGLFSAAELCSAGLSVMIFEPNRFLGRKLRITGKGRCNLTNDCQPEEVMKNLPRNPKFMYSALEKFPPERIMKWFEDAGVPLKTERGRRVFPVSDKAADVSEALCRKCKNAEIIREKVTEIVVHDGKVTGVKTSSGEYFSDHVILAAGGKSYPLTGSDGSGFKLAERLGHTVTDLRPSLVPIETEEKFPEADGFTLKNVTLSLYGDKNPRKPLMQELGELQMTSFGISGPLALTASCMMDSCKGYKLYIDFKPGLTPDLLDRRILREISEKPEGDYEYLLTKLLPREIIKPFKSRIDGDLHLSLGNMPKALREKTVANLKRFELTPTGLRGFDEAIITRGGVSVREINPSTMESKLVKGLYFTGEIIDCDGFTGGYNLTIAFSTAFSAAQDIKNHMDKEKIS